MIPAAELTCMQSAFTKACDQLITVQRNSSLGVPNADGSVPQTLTTLYTNLPALINQPSGGYAQQLASALVDQSSWEIAVPPTFQSAAVAIQRGDVVTWNGLALTVQHLLGSESYQVNINFIASKPR